MRRRRWKRSSRGHQTHVERTLQYGVVVAPGLGQKDVEETKFLHLGQRKKIRMREKEGGRMRMSECKDEGVERVFLSNEWRRLLLLLL
jgi:hypothetical protein